MRDMRIRRLLSGGLITNYFCTSGCGHCLYRSGPHRPRDYIGPERAERLFRLAADLGCRNMHIGGGEPFADPEALGLALEAAARAGVRVEYVETNCSWCKDPDQGADVLGRLKGQGLSTLLVSISPFHNAHIPLAGTRAALEAARIAGIGIFPWVAEFLPDLSALDPEATHSMAEYEQRFGPGYLASIPGRYWVHLGGRALDTFKKTLPLAPAETVLAQAPDSCLDRLADTSHFHLDLYGNYVPGLCSGLAIRAQDLGKPLDPERYPLITTLAAQGLRGLMDLARRQCGFTPSQPGYLNRCHLCDDIRTTLARRHPSQELEPPHHYQ